MRKTLYFLLTILMLIPIVVKADDKYSTNENWIECTYNIGSAAKYSYYYNSTNNVFTPTTSALVTRLTVVSNLKSADFVNKDTNQLFCPSIYVEIGSSSAGATYSASLTKNGNATEYKVTTEKKNVVSTDSDNVKEEVIKKYCTYGNVSFTLDITNKKVLSAEIPNYTISSFEHKFEDLYDINAGECKCVKVKSECTSRGGNYCSIYKSGSEVCYEGYVDDTNQGVIDSPARVNGNFKFCNEDGVLKTFQIVGYLIILIKVLVPLLLIIFGSIDFGKAVVASDDKAIQSAARMLVVRSVAGIIIFFIPTIINAATGLISSWSSVESEFLNCSKCLLKTGECEDIRKNTCTQVKHGSIVSESTNKITKLECSWDEALGSCACNEVTSDK